MSEFETRLNQIEDLLNQIMVQMSARDNQSYNGIETGFMPILDLDGGSGGTAEDNGVFKLDGANLTNCFYHDGNLSFDLGEQSLPSNFTGLACVKTTFTYSTAGVTVNAAMDYSCTGELEEAFAALQTAQGDLNGAIQPIYHLKNGVVTVDFRKMPHFYFLEKLGTART